MKKTASLIFLLFALGHISDAQTITAAKLRGRWKPIELEYGAKRYAITDQTPLENAILGSSEVTLTAEDSALLKKKVGVLVEMFRGMQFDFRTADTVYASLVMMVDGEKVDENDAVRYAIRDGKLIMGVGESKEEAIEVSMPDPRTMIFLHFSGSGGNSLIFRRQ